MSVELTRVLRRLAEVVATEAERNPEFATRLSSVLEIHRGPASSVGPRSSSGGAGSGVRRGNRRPPAAIDPLPLMEQGEDVLRTALGSLDIEQLKDVIAEHGMDTSKLALKWKDRSRLEDLIVSTVRDRLSKGDAFRRP